MSTLVEPPPATLQDKVNALSDPGIYPEPAHRIEAIETHCSWVFLTDSHAYKLKKPMRLDRMDNLLITSRQRSCLEELRLNRRLAPGVYLDVVALRQAATGRLSLEGDGRVVEWLVKMRRLPSELMLDRALARRIVTQPEARAVGELLAAFYARQPPIPMGGEQYVRRIAEQIETTRLALGEPDLELPREIIIAVVSHQREFLDRRPELLMERACGGEIVEAHGDLKPEHVYLGSPPCVIDCLEFDRDLRLLDPLEELAFFSLECERLEASWVAREVLAPYLETSRRTVCSELFEFYIGRRAAQRALTAAWHLRDPRVRAARNWQGLAVSYLTRALEERFAL